VFIPKKRNFYLWSIQGTVGTVDRSFGHCLGLDQSGSSNQLLDPDMDIAKAVLGFKHIYKARCAEVQTDFQTAPIITPTTYAGFTKNSILNRERRVD